MKEFLILGRLGNQLFQFAHIYSEIFYGPNKDYGICFDNPIPDIDFGSLKYPPKFVENENFTGWNESELCFSPDIARLLYLPTPDKQIYFTEKYGNLDNSLFISVRRGDFLNVKDSFLCCNSEYYKKAYEALINCGRDYDTVFITSDDYDWCKENINLDRKVIYLNELAPMATLHFASCCKDFIINTSTFAWWCGWLGEKNGGIVICPNRKFLTPEFEVENAIFFPNRWHKIENMEGLYEV